MRSNVDCLIDTLDGNERTDDEDVDRTAILRGVLRRSHYSVGIEAERNDGVHIAMDAAANGLRRRNGACGQRKRGVTQEAAVRRFPAHFLPADRDDVLPSVAPSE